MTLHIHRRQGEAASARKPCVGLQTFKQRFPQSFIAIRRFYKELGLAGFHGQSFKFAYALQARCAVLRQIADEGEVLSIQSTGNQGQKQRHGPH